MSAKQIPIRDGRYEGGDADIFVVLRMDAEGSGAASGDVHRDHDGERDYVSSFRSAPGTRTPAEGGVLTAIWQDGAGQTTTGLVTVAGREDRPDAVDLTIHLDERLNGLPPGRDLTLTLDRVAAELRELGLEIETEDGVRSPSPVDFHGRPMTLRESLRAAGFAVGDAGEPTLIPRQDDGWDLSMSYTVLDDLMRTTAQSSVDDPRWELHLLMLGKAKAEPGAGTLLGVMFDDAGVLPRQGCAIFAGSIRKIFPDDPDRKTIKTVAHELGHALNLRHRFEREVGQADSSSFMNYDWRYRGGSFEEEYWNAFSFTFDADELEFLRHAPRSAVMPGRSPFPSATYWSRGTGGYSPYLPEVPDPRFRIGLNAPASGSLFLFGQPVFLEVVFANRLADPVTVPADLLDPKGPWLEFRIIRRTSGPVSPEDGMTFTPMMHRCYDSTASAPVTLAAGGTLRGNVNLTFGSSGFSFAEPGTYDIIPILSVPSKSAELGQVVDRVTTGRPLRITVAHPHSLGHERDAMVLLRPDSGAWFALGGAAALAKAGDDLAEVRDRRVAEGGDGDPIAAAITRAEGIDAGRPAVRLQDGRFVERAASPERAADLLGGLGQEALGAFDRHTAEGTVRLAAAYRREAG
ncbi:zinc metalloprotease [Sphaerisporangium corydalis]|uniref:Uncharacterized protein n=1 Tax=Sphaerisporangium corydalis TaxID=1441875 RepID=A0ABV9ERN3_9ACTN|nr:hypothetical protein [Sphaerisporangium corydalis]